MYFIVMKELLMKSIDQKKFISPDLMQITERDVTLLDQEVADGKGWESYCSGQIEKALVFDNRISGICYQNFHQYVVEIKVNNGEISAKCSCDSYGQICIHVVTLLYSWINDSDGFKNIGSSLAELQKKDKEELIGVIARMVTQNPQNVFFISDNDSLDDDFDDIEGMYN